MILSLSQLQIGACFYNVVILSESGDLENLEMNVLLSNGTCLFKLVLKPNHHFNVTFIAYNNYGNATSSIAVSKSQYRML